MCLELTSHNGEFNRDYFCGWSDDGCNFEVRRQIGAPTPSFRAGEGATSGVQAPLVHVVEPFGLAPHASLRSQNAVCAVEAWRGWLIS